MSVPAFDPANYEGQDRLQHVEKHLTIHAARLNDGSQSVTAQQIVLWGDSLTSDIYNASAGGFNYDAIGYWTWASIMLGHRFKLVNLAGHGGFTTAQLLPTLATDVTAYAPAWVLVEIGINDVTNDVASATTIANLTTIYNTFLSAGIKVIATTVPPSTSINTTKRRAALFAVNSFIRSYAQTHNNIVLVDWYNWVADPATASPQTNYTSDGTHPSPLGAYWMGMALAQVLQQQSAPLFPLPFSTLESSNLILQNPMMAGGAGGTEIATGASFFWNATPGTVAHKKVARTDGIIGEWQQATTSGAASDSWEYQIAGSKVGSTTTATGVNAVNSGTVNVGDTTNFSAAGVFTLGGVVVPYTGKTGTSFTGCGDHPATTGGEAITNNLNVGDYVYAVSEFQLDPGSTYVGSGPVPVALELFCHGATSQLQHNKDMRSQSSYIAPPSGIALSGVLRTPTFPIPASCDQLYVNLLSFCLGTVRFGRTQIFKTTAGAVYG